MQKWLFASLGVILSLSVIAQDPIVRQYGEMISEPNLRENLYIIASDAMEGRETGKRGQKMAAAFIRAHFEELGLSGPLNGSYYQPFDLFAGGYGETYVKVEGQQYKNLEQVAYSGSNESGGELNVPALFAGHGRDADLNGLNFKDKAVVLLLTRKDNFTSAEKIHDLGGKMIFVVSPDTADFAEAKGMIQRDIRRSPLRLEKPVYTTGDNGIFYITIPVAEKIMKTSFSKLVQAADADPNKNALKKIKAGAVTYKTSMLARKVSTENVLGYMEGTDRKDELLIITAHYDHIGKRRSGEGDIINNGADDDGSGTVTVMELAKVFATAKASGKGPRRSILFMTVTAEEIGLYGSDYYTSHPVFPLDKTVVDLNIDMIGRKDPQHKESPPYIYVIGADKLSSELNNVSEQINKTYTQLIFDYTYNDEAHPDRLYYRSDHWNFARKNIPIIFYFDGIHEDYHRVTDEVSRIDFELLRKRAQCIFYTAWEIANRDVTIKPDPR